MKKAVLLCASIGWQSRYNDKGEPTGRDMAVSVSWMPWLMSYKRCAYNHHITEEFAARMRYDPQLIDMQVDAVVRCFVNGAARLMEQNHAEPSDMSEAYEELRRGLSEGCRMAFAVSLQTIRFGFTTSTKCRSCRRVAYIVQRMANGTRQKRT